MTHVLLGPARLHAERTALVAGEQTWTYGDLADQAWRLAEQLRPYTADQVEPRVCFLCAPGPEWAATQWAIWIAGAVAVPLAVSHPVPELRYVLEDTHPSVVVSDRVHEHRVRNALRGTEFPIHVYAARRLDPSGPGPTTEPTVPDDRAAMILYTSGTTSRPKGVVSTHGTIAAQVRALTAAWGWRPDDRILHVLPLHHVHGINNVLSCALASGAVCEFAHPFNARHVWERLASGELTVFMAVPTIYRRLAHEWEEADPATRVRWSTGARTLRLMVSGSAALPVPVLERWRELTGHTLLERYGMTEIGMGLSNPLEGERRPGTVGHPLPGVVIRLADERGEPVGEGRPGQIQVRGPQLFREYWERPEATAAAFRDGWFATGDQAVVEDGYFRILGRESIDIIKTGGYKVSALEIEAQLLEHPTIREVAVVGVPDPEWGERVAAVLVLAPDAELEIDALRAWCKERCAPYKVPRTFVAADELPRNAMGKVTKVQARELVEGVTS